MAETGKQKALDTTLASLKKRFGEGTVMKLGESTRLKVGVIPTGSLSLDLALGVGGVPRGRITEIYGPEASGKTTICQHIIAEAQKMGGSRPSSTWSTPSIRPTPHAAASTCRISTFRSRTPASRRWRSPRR